MAHSRKNLLIVLRMWPAFLPRVSQNMNMIPFWHARFPQVCVVSQETDDVRSL